MGMKKMIRKEKVLGVIVEEIKIKQLNPNFELPTRNGAFYDLYIPEETTVEAGQTVVIPLGFACELPRGYHAKIFMRSSTWKNWGLCLSNQCGIIDSSYCGDADEWKLSVYRPHSFEQTVVVPAGTRLAQFTIERDAPELVWQLVDHLKGENRGGFGSTGR